MTTNWLGSRVADRATRPARATSDRRAPRPRTETQARYDDAYRAVGTDGAPPPLRDESESTYRTRLASGLQPFSRAFRDTDLYRLPAAELAPIEAAILADAGAAAADRTRGAWGAPGRLREVRADGGAIEFHGDPRTWMGQFCGPGRAVRVFKGGAGNPLRVNRPTVR